MQELNPGDSSQEPKAPTQIPKPHKKAPWACLQCRARKVRCDVSQTGKPCTRCRRNCESCLEHPSDQRAIMRRRRKEATTMGSIAMNDYVRILSPAKDAMQGVEEQGPSSSTTSGSLSAMPSPRPGDSPSSSVFYLNYQFLEVGNIRNLLSGDIDYLELQGCFLVPRREILDDIIEHYFLHVHPLLPLLNEDDFWRMYDQRGPADSSLPKMSLLVFQSLMFASCNFTSPDTIKALGFSNIRQAKASFYRKAKLLFDFESESSPICIAQAALLLSYRPSYATRGIKRPNTAWLSVAIQNAEIADAHHYASYQPSSSMTLEEGRKHQNKLKRLWWCCIIRDRVLPLCVRRNIQIDRSRFNFAINPTLRYADLEDEINTSRVYSAKSKSHLVRVLERFVELCIVLTDVLSLAYPLDERRADGGALTSDTSKIWRAKNALREWEKDAILRLSDLTDPGKDAWHSLVDCSAPHESVTLYIDLMHMYYHSSWLALCHHEALRLTNDAGQSYNSMSDLSSATTQNQKELHNAASAVTKCLERLNRLQLDRWLPSSAVAVTATPLVLHILDVKLSSLGPSDQSVEDSSRFMQKHRRLKVLIDAMKTYHPQYDGVDFVVSAVRHIVDLVQFEGLQPVIGPAARDSFEWTDILSLNPNLYLRLALTIDLSLSKDRLAEEVDFPPNLRGLFAGDLSPIKALLVQGGRNWPSISGSPIDATLVADPTVISSTMEEWLRWGQQSLLTASAPEGTTNSSDRPLVGEAMAGSGARAGAVTQVEPEVEAEAETEAKDDIMLSPSAIFREGEEEVYAFKTGSDTTGSLSEDPSFNIEDFVGEVVGALSELDRASFVDDMIRAAL